MTVWVVRAGEYGERQDFALDNGICAIGWDSLPDLSDLRNREDLQERMGQVYPDMGVRSIGNWTGQVFGFVREMRNDDLVVLPFKGRPTVAVGKVAGPYRYVPNNPEGARHIRSVVWMRADVPRTAFDQDIRASLGTFMTVFRVRAQDAEERIRTIIGGTPGQTPAVAVEEEAPVELRNLEEYADDDIRQFIDRRFRGHDFTYLVAALLEAKGYRVSVSPSGPDGGVDIVAGRGPMGFELPKLVVQVKSGNVVVDVGVARELGGAMKDFGAEHGLIVSWDGFTRSAIKDARQKYFTLRFWDSEDVIRELKENYDNLPKEMQARLPLKHIWVLVPEEAEAQ